MAGIALSIVAGYGVYLLYTSAVLGWRGLGVGSRPATLVTGRRHHRGRDWLRQAGLEDVAVPEFIAVMVTLVILGGGGAVVMFGGFLPAIVVGAFAATLPLASYRRRREVRRGRAREAWPRIIEEIRIQTASLGRSIPNALFDVGRRGPDELRPAFAAAHREWLISTDFERTISVLKHALAEPTADAACETLLVAHELGGVDLDRRLQALAEDRVLDLQGRKDAAARQAGVRFARRFVLLVPLGMAMAGMSIGNGRAAYGTTLGQFVAAGGVGVVALCWLWSGRIMRIPGEERVFCS